MIPDILGPSQPEDRPMHHATPRELAYWAIVMAYKASGDNISRCPLCKRPVPLSGSRGTPVILSKNRFKDGGPTSTPQLLDCVLLSPTTEHDCSAPLAPTSSIEVGQALWTHSPSHGPQVKISSRQQRTARPRYGHVHLIPAADRTALLQV